VKRIYCEECDELVDFDIKKCSESYHVRDSERITIIADVAHCVQCNTKIFHQVYDAENLNRVYREYNKRVSKEDRIKIDE